MDKIKLLVSQSKLEFIHEAIKCYAKSFIKGYDSSFNPIFSDKAKFDYAIQLLNEIENLLERAWLPRLSKKALRQVYEKIESEIAKAQK